jgi:hypothetical protein
VAVDASGNVYAAGYQSLPVTYNYGNGVTATGTASNYTHNAVLVKYDSTGTAQWARSVSAGTNLSSFRSVAVDGAGNVYAAGEQAGTGTFNYGNGVTVAGIAFDNIVLVKYNSSGTAQWARTVAASMGINLSSWFTSVTLDGAGNVYAAGQQGGAGTHNYGNGVTVAGTGTDVVLVKYNSSGIAQWARTVAEADSYSIFNSVAVDGAGNVYAAGYQNGTGTFNYGNGVTATGTANNTNVVLVKYSE